MVKMHANGSFFFRLVLIAGVMLFLLPPQAAMAAACSADAYMYRSAASGLWEDNATWEVSTDGGTNWNPAGCWPTNLNDSIQIRSGHTVEVSAALSSDQTTVDTGGQVEVDSSITWTIANGSGTDLTVNGTLTVYGTLLNQGSFSISSPATWTVAAAGTYIHNSTSSVGSPLDRATLNAASIFIYRGSSTLNPAVSLANRTYGNLRFESTSGTWSLSSSAVTLADLTQALIKICNS